MQKNRLITTMSVLFNLMLSGFFFLLSSCSSEDKKLNHYVTEVKTEIMLKQSKKKMPPLELEPPKAVIYQVKSSKRSPFNPEVSEVSKVTSPLLIYPVSMLKFVGSLKEDGKVYGYVVAPDTKLYRVSVNDRIGTRNGIVSNITFDRMDILESDPELKDKGAEQIVTLQLKEEIQ